MGGNDPLVTSSMLRTFRLTSLSKPMARSVYVVEVTGGTMQLLTGFCRTTGRDYSQQSGFTSINKEDPAHTDGSGHSGKVCLAVTPGDLLSSLPLFSNKNNSVKKHYSSVAPTNAVPLVIPAFLQSSQY